MGLLDGKVALITGAARGQGRSHAVRFASEGADVIAIDACADAETMPYPMGTEAQLDETIAQIEGHGRRAVKVIADVRSLPAMEEAVATGLKELGKVDIVLANAGICGAVPFLEMTSDQWNETVDVCLSGVFNTARAAAPSMVERGEGGAMVLTSSSMGLRSYPNMVHYAAAKTGVVAMAKAIALELGPHSIRVNAVCPTTVKTPMVINQALFDLFAPDKDSPTEDDVREPFMGLNALPNLPWIEAGDVTDSILFLCSDAAKYLTGVALPVDAGNVINV